MISLLLKILLDTESPEQVNSGHNHRTERTHGSVEHKEILEANRTLNLCRYLNAHTCHDVEAEHFNRRRRAGGLLLAGGDVAEGGGQHGGLAESEDGLRQQWAREICCSSVDDR